MPLSCRRMPPRWRGVPDSVQRSRDLVQRGIGVEAKYQHRPSGEQDHPHPGAAARHREEAHQRLHEVDAAAEVAPAAALDAARAVDQDRQVDI